MKRRAFLQSTLVGSAAALAAPTQGIPKRTYKGDVKVSMIAFGGIVVVGMEQKDAGRAVAEAFDRGVNYFDVAPSYFSGEAEMKLGPALAPYRAKSFLACKTMERGAAGARQELEQSLGRLRTDHFDLYQFHAVSSVAEVDRILAAGGAAETFVKAREEGKVRFLVTEDDAQNGVDHVDGHRTLALVIGPFIRRGVVDSNNYTHLSLVRTIQEIFHIPARTRFLEAARPMTSIFMAQADTKPYEHLIPKQAIDEMNPPLQALDGRRLLAARQSLAMNFSEPDRAPAETLNRILWWDAKGYDTPYPKRK